MKTFNIEHYSDGRRGQFGNEYNLSLNDTIEELLSYNLISENYDAAKLETILNELKNSCEFGERWQVIKVTANN